MPEVTQDLRTTTISLDEYNKLRDLNLNLKETIGAKDETVRNLNTKIAELNEKQPLVKVIHMEETYDDNYDDYGDYEGRQKNYKHKKVEFINLTEVTGIALQKAREVSKEEIEALKYDVKQKEYTIKELRDNVDTVQEKLNSKDKQIKKLGKEQSESYLEQEESYNKKLKDMNKAYQEDTKNYKETIKELKEEIQKVKDSKTDAEIEEKRNQEIKDLKGRIKDLENMIAELGKLNFFKRTFKLRTISAEKLAAQKQLLEREKNANAVGTTWTREGNKYRRFNAFEEMFRVIRGYYDRF
jgi:DNA repair exonuclease SbcCD ATPase subunit